MKGKTITVLLIAFLLVASVFSGCQVTTTDPAAPATEPSASSEGGAAPAEASEGAAPAADKEELTVFYWTIPAEEAETLKVIEAFNARDDVGTTIKLDSAGSDQYKIKLSTLMAADEVPDVFSVQSAGFMAPYVTAGKVYALDEEFTKDPEWRGSFVSDSLFESISFDGKTYAVPATQGPGVMFYNKEIFDAHGLAAPTTYEELKNIVATLRGAGINPFAFGDKTPWVGALMCEVIGNRVGAAAAFDNVMNGTGTWEDPAFAAATNIMVELDQLGAFPEGYLGIDYDQTISMFTEGKGAMLVMGAWVQGLFEEEGAAVKGKIDVCNFPAVEGGAGSPNIWLNQNQVCWSVAEKSTHKEDAVALLKMFTGPDAQRSFAENAGSLIVTNVQLDPAKVNPLSIKVTQLQESMEKVSLYYDVQLSPLLGNEYNNVVQAILAGKDATEAFAEFQQFAVENADAA